MPLNPGRVHGIASAAWLLGLLALGPVPATAGDDSPRLVLVLVLDQLRRDRVHADLPGGIGRLMREGRVYAEGVVDHGITETCAGHVTLLSGRHPGPAGVPGNRFLDGETGASVYCVEDSAEDARVLGATHGRSPRLVRVSMLGDWMKRAWPRTRVFSVSAKDRAAITMGGRRPDAAYWLRLEGDAGFTTSRYYLDALPPWVDDWNGVDPMTDGFLADLPEHWEHDGSGRRDDGYFAESSEFGRTSGHPLRARSPQATLENVWSSPFLDDVTLDFTRRLIEREALGTGPAIDLLAVSLSGTDAVGHLYGPESAEARAALEQVDASLGDLLDFLDARLGHGRTLIALTSDHGVLPIPEWLAETGRSACPVAGGRADLRWLAVKLTARIHWRFGPLLSMPGRLLGLAGSQLRVNRSLARAHGIDVEAVIRAAEAWAEAEPAIREAWTRDEIATGTDEIASLYRNSFDPERSADIVLQLERTCVISAGAGGTGHGTPYLYDRAVPLILYGPGLEPGTVRTRARTVDIAPTLAAILGLETPRDLDGVRLD